MGENLRAHIDDALLSRKVATIRTDAPVELDFDETSFPAFSADEVSAALGTLGITAMQNRFLALVGGEGGAAAASSVVEIPAMSAVKVMQDTPEIVENFGVSLSNLLFTTPATLLLPA